MYLRLKFGLSEGENQHSQKFKLLKKKVKRQKENHISIHLLPLIINVNFMNHNT